MSGRDVGVQGFGIVISLFYKIYMLAVLLVFLEFYIYFFLG